MSSETQHIAPNLRLKIAEAIKTRSSLEILLQNEQFIGTKESIAELLQVLQDIMGNRMMLEFVFSSHIAIWDEYRSMIDVSDWKMLAERLPFSCEHYILLGTSLVHRSEIRPGTEFLKKAAESAHDTKSFLAVADAVHTHLNDNTWAEKILLEASKHCDDVDHFIPLAEAMITIAEDRDASITLFNKALKRVTVAHEFMEIAAAVARTLKDKAWAQEIFNRHSSVPASGTPIEMLAEESFNDEMKA